MGEKRAFLISILLVLLLLLDGCMHNVEPHSVATADLKGKVPVPARFKSSYLGGSVKDGWLKSFRDPVLNRLVKEAQRKNPNLALAASRVQRAAATMRLTESGMLPRLDIVGDYEYRSYAIASSHDVGSGAFSLSWEPDLWGRISNMAASDCELTVAEMADYEYARQSLSANTAKAWFQLGADRMIYEFSKRVVGIQEQVGDILQKRAAIGQGNMRDVHMSRGMVAEAREAAQAALTAKQRDARALETIIGRYPASTIGSRRLVAVPPSVPSGVPADLLNRRPDIVAARYRVAAAFHNKKAAELLRLPSINLGVTVGADVIEGTMAKLIGGLFMPVFDAGAVQARIDAASADQKAAIANYRAVVLRAFREVENALAQERQLARRYAYLSTMVKEFKTAYDMTYKNYKIGQGTLLDVLNVQAKWINARIARVQILKERLVNRVNLHLALGGSFEKRNIKRR